MQVGWSSRAVGFTPKHKSMPFFMCRSFGIVLNCGRSGLFYQGIYDEMHTSTKAFSALIFLSFLSFLSDHKSDYGFKKKSKHKVIKLEAPFDSQHLLATVSYWKHSHCLQHYITNTFLWHYWSPNNYSICVMALHSESAPNQLTQCQPPFHCGCLLLKQMMKSEM